MIDISQIKKDFDTGVLLSRATVGSVIDDLVKVAAVVAQGRSNFIERILLGVAEIPDRDSPEDQPEMMLVTSGELREIIESAFEADDEQAPQPVAAPLFDAMGLGDVAMPSVKRTQSAAALSETAASTVALGEPVAKQIIAAPASRSFCGGAPNAAIIKMMEDKRAAQNAQLNSDWGDAAPDASQQPVPALSTSIDTPEFVKMLDAYCTDGSKGYSHWHSEIVAHVDAWAAQLVQKRATLSDEEILMIARHEGMATHDCTLNPMEYAVGYARAILTAAGAA